MVQEQVLVLVLARVLARVQVPVLVPVPVLVLVPVRAMIKYTNPVSKKIYSKKRISLMIRMIRMVTGITTYMYQNLVLVIHS